MKIRKISTIFLCLLMVGAAFAVVSMNIGAEEEPPEDPGMEGEGEWWIDANGTYFELTNSSYLNITFTSSENIHLYLVSIPRMIDYQIEANCTADSTDITISGFEVNTTYYRYQEGDLQEEFTSDESGNYSYTQDISIAHHVYIQEMESTITINSDGTINPPTAPIDRDGDIYTLTANIFESINIHRSGLTLDGGGYFIQGSGSGNGVYLRGCNSVTIENLDIRDFSYGIYQYQCDGHTFNGNTISACFKGIRLYQADSNTCNGNTISADTYGIELYLSSSHTFNGNTVSSDSTAILLQSSDSNTFNGNTVSADYISIGLGSSAWITLSDNEMTGGGISIGGTSLSYWNTHTIDTLNTIDGKPVYYYKDISGGTVPAGAGQVILVSCSNMIVENQDIGYIYMGIIDVFGSGNTIQWNTISARYSIRSYYSESCTVSGNTISTISAGIFLEYSDSSTVSGNTISLLGSGTGIFLEYSGSSTVSGNTISDSHTGIYLERSGSSTVSGNTLSASYRGIFLEYSDGSTVSTNTISILDDKWGIYLQYTDSTTLNGNTISGDNLEIGIRLYRSEWITLSNNEMTRGGISITGGPISYWDTHTIDTTNTVGGKPVQYHKSTSGVTIPAGAGQVILVSCSNMIVENQDISDVYMGIVVVFGSGNTIRWNTVSVSSSNTYCYGIAISSSSSSTVNGNTVSTSLPGYGIFMEDSGGSTVSGNTVSGCTFGIYMSYSSNSMVSGNTISASRCGIYLSSSMSSTVSENTVSVIIDCIYGIYLYSSSSSIISGNTVSVSGDDYGIYVSSSGSCTVSGNTITGVSKYGIYLGSSGSCTISSNTVSAGEIGIHLQSSHDSTVSGNTISGVNLDIGIHLYSTGITLSNNAMTRGGISIGGTSVSYWDTHTIDTTNTVDGKPVQYRKSTSGETIPVGAGQVILVSCSNMIVENQNFPYIYMGIVVMYGSGNTIRWNTVSAGYWGGIHLYYSASSTLSGNMVSAGEYGIYLDHSSNSIVTENTVSVPDGNNGIYLYYSDSSTVSGNTVSVSGVGMWTYGIYLDYSGSSTVNGNTVSAYYHGIYLRSSSSSTVNGNTISVSVLTSGYGIRLYSTNSCTINGNTISTGYWGIIIYGTDHTVNENTIILPGHGYGIEVSGSGIHTVNGNTVSDGTYGIHLRYADSSTISGNTVSGCSYYGIGLYDVSGSSFVMNTISNNNYGLYLRYSNGNTFHCNNIIDNTYQLYNEQSTNTWDNGAGEGNFWSDYPGQDTDWDGVGDTYLPHRGVDWYPLMNPCPNTAPTISSFTIAEGTEGSPVEFTVTASDDGLALYYSFDFESDGTYDITGTSSTVYHVFPDDFSATATVLVSDGRLSVEATTPYTILNVAPEATILGGIGVAENYILVSNYYTQSYFIGIEEGGTFTSPELIDDKDYRTYGAGIGDFDNDGDLDALVGDRYDTWYYEKLGTGNDFAPAVSIDSTNQNYRADFAEADYNGDGNLDAIMANWYGAYYTIYLGNGDGTFSRTTMSAPYYVWGMDSADFNGDGNMDFIATSYYYGTRIYLGNGDGTFQSPIYFNIRYSRAVCAGDFDNDGNDDFIAGSTLYFYPGNGDGTFGSPVSLGFWAYALAESDIDGDGNLDLVYTDYYNMIYRTGNGDGTFTYVSTTYVTYSLYGIATSPEPGGIEEGDMVQFYGTFSDPGWLDTHTATWNWGDNSPTESGTVTEENEEPFATGEVTGEHLFVDNGVFTVTLTVTDDDNGAGSDTAEITVVNVDPTCEITGPEVGSVIPTGTPVVFTGAFTDPGTQDTHTASWNLNSWYLDINFDGEVDEIDGSGTVTGTYTFDTAGVYNIKLTVIDDDNGVGSASTIGELTAFIVVYDPEGGFVTGGGWIDSPWGAYKPNPSLMGKATFGFVSKYLPGTQIPTGQTEFQFKVADLNFHSTSYDWLVVAGPHAQYKGTGTINGEGEYKFKIWATDGNLPGGGGEDKFRIKIWEEDIYGNEYVIYDNEDETELGGGSIKIHKG